MTVRLFNVERTLSQAEKAFDKEAEMTFRANGLSAYADIVRSTPVDTGRARNSWRISYDQPNLVDDQSVGDSAPARLAPRPAPTVIYFANGTDYINQLNEGSSQQAPSRFVETAVLNNIPGVITSDIVEEG